MGLLAVASVSTASQAETGSVRVVFTKAGFIVGVGGGRGVLTFRGHHYPFTVSGMSFGATIGASTNQLAGRALNLHAPGDFAGTKNSDQGHGRLLSQHHDRAQHGTASATMNSRRLMCCPQSGSLPHRE
jgi:hypothetical protein